jgi:hypothetical protein
MSAVNKADMCTRKHTDRINSWTVQTCKQTECANRQVYGHDRYINRTDLWTWHTYRQDRHMETIDLWAGLMLPWIWQTYGQDKDIEQTYKWTGRSYGHERHVDSTNVWTKADRFSTLHRKSSCRAPYVKRHKDMQSKNASKGLRLTCEYSITMWSLYLQRLNSV